METEISIRSTGSHDLLYWTVGLQQHTLSMYTAVHKKLECGPMPNVMAALPNRGGALCSTPQSMADAHYWSTMQQHCHDAKPTEISWGAPNYWTDLISEMTYNVFSGTLNPTHLLTHSAASGSKFTILWGSEVSRV